MADTVRVGLDRLVLDAVGREAFEKRVEPDDGEGDPTCAGPVLRLRLDEEPGVVIDLPENLRSDAPLRGSPEEPRVPIDAGFEIGVPERRRRVG